MGAIFQIMYLPLLLPFWLSFPDGTFPWKAPFWLVLTYIVFAVPLLLSWTTVSLNEHSHRRESEWFETTVMQLGENVGIDWTGHLTTRIDKLLAEGHQSQAVKLYRQEAGATWDDAYLALDNWSQLGPLGPSAPTRLQLRVQTLTTQMEKRLQKTIATGPLCETVAV
jgi:hypothetical protein